MLKTAIQSQGLPFGLHVFDEQSGGLAGIGLDGEAGADNVVEAAQEEVGDGFAAQHRRGHSQNSINTGGHGVSRNSGGLFGVPLRGGGATGSLSTSTPRAPARAAARLMMRVLSTQDPMCRTGGIFRASQIARNPGPARAAALSSLKPALALATAVQPVSRTRISLAMSCRVMVVCPRS